MCDSQVLLADNGIWFGKNSDREPHEPQAVVHLPAVRGDTASTVQTTYLRIPQLADRHAVLLSKPCWLWGAEMGLNEHGLVIGNEAVFTRQSSLEPGLLGMDLLRLALERCRNCDEAISLIGAMLEEYGQGGPAGLADKGFHYDNSFILADPQQAWILETAGRQWAARPVRGHAAISNALSLGNDYQRCSAGLSDSFRRFDTRLMPWLAGSHQRRALSLHRLEQTTRQTRTPGFHHMAAHLRSHHSPEKPPLRGSNRDVCLHAAGPIRRSQTTGSLIVWLGLQGPRAVITGASAPCLSLYRPLDFSGQAHVLSPRHDQADLWQHWQRVHAAALFDQQLRRRLQARIAEIEKPLFQRWMKADADIGELDDMVRRGSEEIMNWPELDRASRRWPLTPARWRWRSQA